MSAAPQVVKLDLEDSETFVLLVGDVSLLVVSVHESGTLEQTFLGEEPD